MNFFHKTLFLTNEKYSNKIGSMKLSSVKRKVNQLIKHYGGYDEAGQVLGITGRYVRLLVQGKKQPGRHLHRFICQTYEQVHRK